MGINQREADVAASFQRAIDKVIELRPDIIVFGGDIFHTVRPTNPAILHAFTQLGRLVKELPATMIVMVAGNHDTPRTAETGCILKLFSPLGIHVVEGQAQRITGFGGRVSVLGIPDLPGELPAFETDSSAEFNVMVIHGEVEGVIPSQLRYSDRATSEIKRQELAGKSWDYIGLGHYHVYQKVGPNAYYSGSLDYTSFDVWGEMREERVAGIYVDGAGGKGIVEHNLVTGEHRFHNIPITRQFVDLRPIDAVGMTAADLDIAIAERVSSIVTGVDDKIIRLIVRDVPRHIVHELDHKAIREYKRRALHFNLDTRRPEVKSRSFSGVPTKRPSLADIVSDKLKARVLNADVDRDQFVGLGLEYLEKTAALANPSSVLSEDEG